MFEEWRNFFLCRKKTNHSLSWRGVLDTRNIHYRGIRWIVGNGHSINFRGFNWMLPYPLANLVPHDQSSQLEWSLTVEKNFCNHSWNVSKLRMVLPSHIVCQQSDSSSSFLYLTWMVNFFGAPHQINGTENII